MAFCISYAHISTVDDTHTACSSADSPDWTIYCIRIESGRNRGKFGCIHRDPHGLRHAEEIFISDLINLNVLCSGQGGYTKEN